MRKMRMRMRKMTETRVHQITFILYSGVCLLMCSYYKPPSTYFEYLYFLTERVNFDTNNIPFGFNRTVPFFPPESVIEMKNNIRFSNISQNYLFRINSIYEYYLRPGMRETESPPVHESVTVNKNKYFVVKDCLVNRGGVIITNNARCNSQWRELSILTTHGCIEGHYKEGIYFGNYFLYMYGHLIKDVFGPLQYIPKDILKTVPFVITTDLKIVYELMKIFDINASNAITFKSADSYIHFDKIYTVSLNDSVHYNHGYTMQKLAELMRRKLNLSNEKPTKYVLTNRNSTKRRLYNFEDFVELVNTTYNEYNWEVWEDSHGNLSQTARKWNTAKFLFASTGSNLDNCIFMQPMSTIHALFFDWYDHPIVASVYSMHIFLVVTPNRSCRHFEDEKCLIDFNETIQDMKYSLYTAKHGHFPSEKNIYGQTT